MKPIILLLIMTMTSFQLTSQTQTIIFQPGPGLNDGFDDGSIEKGKDGYTYLDNPNTNYGTGNSITTLPISTCNDAEVWAYIQFNLDSLPDYWIVDSVLFGVTHFEHTGYCYSNCVADFYFHRLLAPWDEMDLTYNNAPSYDSASFFGPLNITFPNNFGTMEYDITQMYKDWKSGLYPNYGFTIQSPTVGCNNAAVMFNVRSSDDTTALFRPYLKVVYTPTGQGISDDVLLKLSTHQSGENLSVMISGPSDEYALQIFDLTGRINFREHIACNRWNIIPITNFSKGIYLINVHSNNGTITRKVLVQ